jgi:hypothetical protein
VLFHAEVRLLLPIDGAFKNVPMNPRAVAAALSTSPEVGDSCLGVETEVPLRSPSAGLSSIFTSSSDLIFTPEDSITRTVRLASEGPCGFELDEARELSGDLLPIGLPPFLLRDLSFKEEPEDVRWSVRPRLSSELDPFETDVSFGDVIVTGGELDITPVVPLGANTEVGGESASKAFRDRIAGGISPEESFRFLLGML